jgi:RNA polymerase sigma-70 factor (ECF subfamily)
MSTTTMPPFWADPDAQLMLSAGRGDISGLAQLIEKHYNTVLRYCLHRVRDFAAAEELTQEVFLRVHGSRTRYQPSARFTTWLYRIASNVVLNWIRDTSRERGYERLDAVQQRGFELQLPDGGMPADEWISQQSRAAELRRAIEELPERQRAVLQPASGRIDHDHAIRRDPHCGIEAARAIDGDAALHAQIPRARPRDAALPAHDRSQRGLGRLHVGAVPGGRTAFGRSSTLRLPFTAQGSGHRSDQRPSTRPLRSVSSRAARREP